MSKKELRCKKIVIEESCQKEWEHIASVLANDLDLTVEAKSVPENDAVNIGFWSFFEQGSFDCSKPEPGGIVIQELPEGGIIVSGADKFSICHAALYLVDLFNDSLLENDELISINKTPTFKRLDVAGCDYITGFSRNADNFDMEVHVQDMVRTGVQSLEINQLYNDIPIQVRERLVWQDKYQWWCAYKPGLDMFYESEMNRGTFSKTLLEKNREHMMKMADLARKYGLKPIYLAFEPRVWPERLFAKYPEMRGARVDMPTYSAEAEYAPDVNHPMVQQHYKEMCTQLLEDIPDLDLIEIWTNDSNAGFAWSKHLYTGPNGPVMSRKHHTSVSVVNFMKTLRDAGRAINPDLRLRISLNWFDDEEPDMIMENLPEDIDVSSTIFPVKVRKTFAEQMEGIDNVYSTFETSEAEREFFCMDRRIKRDWDIWEKSKKYNRNLVVEFEEVSTPWKPLAPLQGFPYPYAAYEMLLEAKEHTQTDFAVRGGLTSKSFVPYFINNDVIRAFQYDYMSFDELLESRAKAWTASAEEAELLMKTWKKCDEIYRMYDSDYWTVGLFVSARTLFRRLVRPMVPDARKLEHLETRHYRPMEFLVGESDPSWYDCFYYGYGQITSDKEAFLKIKFCNLLLEKARKIEEELDNAGFELSEALADLHLRIQGFICMTETDRSIFAIQLAIHDCEKAENQSEFAPARQRLRDEMEREIENTQKFYDLLKRTEDDVTLFTVSSGEDNVYHLRAPLSHQLKLKAKIMNARLDDTINTEVEG